MGLNAGDLRHVCTLENPGAPVPDGEGGFIYVWTALVPSPWWAAISNASARNTERHFASTVIAHATHIADGRYHPGITTQTRVTWTDYGGRVHQAQVLDVEDVDGSGVESIVLLSEIAP